MTDRQACDFTQLAADIKTWGKLFGFQEIGIADTDVQLADQRLQQWLAKGHHGSMEYLNKNKEKRANPNLLVENTLRIICARMNYFPAAADAEEILNNPDKAYISRYALGRDYHKLIRKRLSALAKKISTVAGPFGYRAFADSAPVFEKPLSAKAGLGWMGKHTLIMNRDVGSWFFLGVLYTDLPLPVDTPITDHCGTCRACLDICPTQAIIAPYQLDATQCISYLTIENKGSIPTELRSKMGNRIFGCDDCQLACPWNKFAQFTDEVDFQPRHQLDNSQLIDLFAWTEAEFLKRTEGSAIRRTGYLGWLRNIAVALGNAPSTPEITQALQARQAYPNPMVREHISWALKQHSA